MTTVIPASLRREIIKRANGCCEYCLVHRDDRLLPYHIDHIIAEKHGGQTISENLCLSCYLCNRYKGSDVASVDWSNDGEVISPSKAQLE
jgi:5-methylcytosine-specific restriction endonuclease McrA